MIKREKHLSEFELALTGFKKSKTAYFSAIVLLFLYGGSIFAGFLTPYSYKTEDKYMSYAPPTRIEMFHRDRLTWPFVYEIVSEFGEFHKRIYRKDFSKRYLIKLFVKGDQYKILGLIPSRTHLWGVESPGRIFLLGADSRGRDIYSRLLYGGRVSLSIGLIGVLISFTLGLIVGGISGYYGGKVDNILMRVAEMFMMVPGFYLLLALRAAVPPEFSSVQTYIALVVILSFIGWAGLARVIRGMCLSLRERDYVVAAKSMGISDFKIIINHILPHTLSYSIFAVMLSIPGYILGESALSLIGLGIQDPYASWGNMLSDAMSIVRINFFQF